MGKRVTRYEDFTPGDFVLEPGRLYEISPIGRGEGLGLSIEQTCRDLGFRVERGAIICCVKKPEKVTITLRGAKASFPMQCWQVCFLADDKVGYWTLSREAPVDYKYFLFEMSLRLIQVK